MRISFLFALSLFISFSALCQQKKLVATYHSVKDPNSTAFAEALKDSGLPIDKIQRATNVSKATITIGKLWIESNTSSFKYVDRFVEGEYKKYYIAPDPSEWEQLSFYIKDLSAKKLYVVGNKLGKDQAVVDNLSTYNSWKLVAKDSTVNGLPCRLAVNQKYGYRAWYTPKIPLAHGPEIFGGLPGLIVVLELPDQERSLVLQHIKEEYFDSKVLAVGEVKKKLTYEEYKKLGY